MQVVLNPYAHLHILTYISFLYLEMSIYLPTMVSIILHLYFPVTRSFQALFARFKCQYNDLLGLGLPGTYIQSFSHTSQLASYYLLLALQHLSIVCLGVFFIFLFCHFTCFLHFFVCVFFFAASVDKPLKLLFI